MNPFSTEMMKVYHSYRILNGLDANCADYIDFASGLSTQTVKTETRPANAASGIAAETFEPLKHAVIKGLKENRYSCRTDGRQYGPAGSGERPDNPRAGCGGQGL